MRKLLCGSVADKMEKFCNSSESAAEANLVSMPATGSHSEKEEEEDLEPLVLTSIISPLSQQFCEAKPISAKQVKRKQAMDL